MFQRRRSQIGGLVSYSIHLHVRMTCRTAQPEHTVRHIVWSVLRGVSECCHFTTRIRWSILMVGRGVGFTTTNDRAKSRILNFKRTTRQACASHDNPAMPDR